MGKGLSYQQKRILLLLKEEPCSIHELKKFAGYTNCNIYPALKSLEEKSYITKHKANYVITLAGIAIIGLEKINSFYTLGNKKI